MYLRHAASENEVKEMMASIWHPFSWTLLRGVQDKDEQYKQHYGPVDMTVVTPAIRARLECSGVTWSQTGLCGLIREEIHGRNWDTKL